MKKLFRWLFKKPKSLKNKIYMKNTIESVMYGSRIDFNNKAIYFYDGMLSPLEECSFLYEPLGETLTSVQKGLSLCKAKFFKDEEAYNSILKDESPYSVCNFGQEEIQIKGFDLAQWTQVCFNFLVDLNYQKFKQNQTWKEMLLLSEGFELVYAAYDDPIWGIGIAPDNVEILSRANWKGQNFLGKALTNVRSNLIIDLQDIENPTPVDLENLPTDYMPDLESFKEEAPYTPPPKEQNDRV